MPVAFAGAAVLQVVPAGPQIQSMARPSGAQTGDLLVLAYRAQTRHAEMGDDPQVSGFARITVFTPGGSARPTILFARRIVAIYHGEEAARREAEEFRSRFTLRQFPDDTAERITLPLSEAGNLTQLLVKVGAAKSSREAQRLVDQGGLKVIDDPAPHAFSEPAEADKATLSRRALTAGVYKLKIGKTRFAVVTLE